MKWLYEFTVYMNSYMQWIYEYMSTTTMWIHVYEFKCRDSEFMYMNHEWNQIFDFILSNLNSWIWIHELFTCIHDINSSVKIAENSIFWIMVLNSVVKCGIWLCCKNHESDFKDEFIYALSVYEFWHTSEFMV